jgi:hypothetical protein
MLTAVIFFAVAHGKSQETRGIVEPTGQDNKEWAKIKILFVFQHLMFYVFMPVLVRALKRIGAKDSRPGDGNDCCLV